MVEQDNYNNRLVKTQIRNNKIIASRFPAHKSGYTIKEYVWADLKLDVTEALIYAIISSYGYYTCNIARASDNAAPSSLNSITGLATSTLRRILKNLVEDGIISVAQINVTPSIKRNIYVANYNECGRLSYEDITQQLEAGIKNCLLYYGSGDKGYTRGRKART